MADKVSFNTLLIVNLKKFIYVTSLIRAQNLDAPIP